MTIDARLIQKSTAGTERWEHSERGDYDLVRCNQEFQDRLYSEKGREFLRMQKQTPESDREPSP